MIGEWTQITIEALQRSLYAMGDFLPRLIGAIIFFLIGWMIAKIGEVVIIQLLLKLKLNQFFERTGWREALEKAEIKVNLAEFIGSIFKWVLIIVFLSAAIEILGFHQFADLLNRFIAWLPNLIVAIAIFIVAIIVAEILEKVIKASVKKMGINYVGLIGGIVKWGIYIFSILLILSQLDIGKEIVNALIYGIVGTLTLALGLSFGLGGREAAGEIIKEVKKKIIEK